MWAYADRQTKREFFLWALRGIKVGSISYTAASVPYAIPSQVSDTLHLQTVSVKVTHISEMFHGNSWSASRDFTSESEATFSGQLQGLQQKTSFSSVPHPIRRCVMCYSNVSECEDERDEVFTYAIELICPGLYVAIIIFFRHAEK
jgi:hypothetical protein